MSSILDQILFYRRFTGLSTLISICPLVHISFNFMIMYIFIRVYIYTYTYIYVYIYSIYIYYTYILLILMYYRNLPVDCLHAVGLASNVRSRKEQNGNVPAKNMTQESPKSTYPLVGSLGVQVHRKHAH